MLNPRHLLQGRMDRQLQDFTLANNKFPHDLRARETGPACEVYVFGSNGERQLGLQHDRDISTPELCMLLPPAAASGTTFINSGNFTVFLPRRRGTTMAFGNHPPSGLNVFNNRPENEELPRLAAATWDTFAFAIRRSGRDIIHTFGSSDKGQLGRPPEMGPEPSLDNGTAAAVVKDVFQIAAGVQHFVAVVEGEKNNRVPIGWGNGRKGQLGEPAQAVVEKPRVIEGIDFSIRAVVCGREFTVFLGNHERGEVHVLGSDKFGIRSNAPKSIKNWKQAGAGWGSVSVLCQDGSVVSWGRNDHGQLAPEGLPLIDQIAVGSEHTVAITRPRMEGKKEIPAQVIAWGWGEHGNCGPDVDAAGDVKGRWSVIPIPPRHEDSPSSTEATASGTQAIERQPVGVAAGHATSWFWVKETDSLE